MSRMEDRINHVLACQARRVAAPTPREQTEARLVEVLDKMAHGAQAAVFHVDTPESLRAAVAQALQAPQGEMGPAWVSVEAFVAANQGDTLIRHARENVKLARVMAQYADSLIKELN